MAEPLQFYHSVPVISTLDWNFRHPFAGFLNQRNRSLHPAFLPGYSDFDLLVFDLGAAILNFLKVCLDLPCCFPLCLLPGISKCFHTVFPADPLPYKEGQLEVSGKSKLMALRHGVIVGKRCIWMGEAEN